MKVEIVSVGTPLLMSDVLDTNTAQVTRSLREIGVQLTCKVTVGEDLPILVDVLQVALRRAQVILVIGGKRKDGSGVVPQAISRLQQGEEPFEFNCFSVDGESASWADTAVSPDKMSTIICLPSARRELGYILENQVLPYLQLWVTRGQPRELLSDWILLRTVGMMESSIRQQLADLLVGKHGRITLQSFAGQTEIRLLTKARTTAALQQELERLREEVVSRLGDHVYGVGKDRLEQVILDMMQQSGIRLVLAECHTHGIMATTLLPLPDVSDSIEIVPAKTGDELADYLQLERLQPESDLSRWCRVAAIELHRRSATELGLVVYNNYMPGGTQVLVTLASDFGVSVTQRSFGGHPDSLDQWSCTLGLAHLRRWLLVHRTA